MVKIHALSMAPHVEWLVHHRKRLLVYGVGGIFGLLMLAQFCYPSDRLLPFVRIDGVWLGLHTKQDAVATLNKNYASYPVAIYIGSSAKPAVAPTLADMEITVDNTERVNSMAYPWYMRLVPSSLFWYQLWVPATPNPHYAGGFDDYIDTTLMPNCKVTPVNATLKATDGALRLVQSRAGNQCTRDGVVKTLRAITPKLDLTTAIHVSSTELAAKVTDAMAQREADIVTTHLKSGVELVSDGAVVTTVPMTEILSWLDISTTNDVLKLTVNTTRASKWLSDNVAPKVASPAGTSYVTTYDFTEVSRQNGKSGRALDVANAVDALQQVVDGSSPKVILAETIVAPTVQYTRSYSASDTGFSALLANYAKDHNGTFGVSYIELDGKKRHADYQGDKRFVTASTYKLFAAYELLKQIDAGTRSWDNESTCFNKMISLSDNACAEAYLDSLGLSTITKDIQAIGLKNSTFMISGGPFTTANDLSLLLGMVQSQQNFSSVNRDRLISAMKSNVYRKGIPAGVNGTVADKVGFLDGLLHDAAIVYSPNGTYVLVIMTDGSSWATIADLAKQVDNLHAQ